MWFVAVMYRMKIFQLIYNFILKQSNFNFKDTGELFMARRNNEIKIVEEREANVNVSCNWEEYPEFGDYSRLIILEREKE